MGIHTLPKEPNRIPTASLQVDRIVLELPVHPPLDEGEQCGLDAFDTFKNGKQIETSKIAKAADKCNQNHVRGTLWSLVSNGYIAAYRKRDKWKWCDRDTAQRMIDRNPDLQVAYCDELNLPKRVSDRQPI